MSKKFLKLTRLAVPFLSLCMAMPSAALAVPADVLASNVNKEVVIMEQAQENDTMFSITKSVKGNDVNFGQYALITARNTDKEIGIRIDGKEYKQDDTTGYADIVNDRTMVPIRLVTEGLGYKVDWTSETQTIAMSDGERVVIHKVGDYYAVDQNYVRTVIDATSYIDFQTERTMVSIRLIAEAFGCKVEWKEEGSRFVVDITRPSENVNKKGYAEAGISRDYLIQAAESLHFYEEGGKYYVEGNLPVLPADMKAAGLYAQCNIEFTGANNSSADYKVTTIEESHWEKIPKEGAFKVELPNEIQANIRTEKSPINTSRVGVTYSIRGNEGNQVENYGEIFESSDGKVYLNFGGSSGGSVGEHTEYNFKFDKKW